MLCFEGRCQQVLPLFFFFFFLLFFLVDLQFIPADSHLTGRKRTEHFVSNISVSNIFPFALTRDFSVKLGMAEFENEIFEPYQVPKKQMYYRFKIAISESIPGYKICILSFTTLKHPYHYLPFQSLPIKMSSSPSCCFDVSLSTFFFFDVSLSLV